MTTEVWERATQKLIHGGRQVLMVAIPIETGQEALISPRCWEGGGTEG